MKTIKPVEQATDYQLRQLARPFQWQAPYQEIIQSQLAMMTVERAEIINLLKSNSIFQFAIQ